MKVVHDTNSLGRNISKQYQIKLINKPKVASKYTYINMIQELAYKKAYLHALKFIKDDVIGVLTGRIEGGNIIVEDAYPLFHTRIVAPTLESAFFLIEGVVKKKNQVIVGVYEALAHPSLQKYLSEISTRILDKIEKNLNASPIALRIYDEDQEEQDEEIVQYHYLTSEGFRFSLKDSKQIEANYQRIAEISPEKGVQIFEKMSENIRKNDHRFIVDFDMHFEDISLDFTNSYVL